MTNTPNLGLTQYAGTDTIDFLTQYNTDLDKIDDYSVATNTNIGTLASLKTAVKTSTVGAINEVYDTTDNGWISARATLTYASASAPTFVCNTSIDLTTRISVGMKIKLTQTTTKYFFVTAITSTTITLYGGTDYVVANTTISNVYYSIVKLPYGFPMNPDKWSVQFVSTSDALGTPPSTNTWWNPSSTQLAIPIGSWNIYGKVASSIYTSTAGSFYYHYTTLSTSNSSETYSNTTNVAFSNTNTPIIQLVFSTVLNFTTSTKVYLLQKCNSDGTLGQYCGFKGSLGATFIKATCAYL